MTMTRRCLTGERGKCQHFGELVRLHERVKTFCALRLYNDPHGERDFGTICQELNGACSILRPGVQAIGKRCPGPTLRG